MAPRKDHAKSRKSDLPYVTNSLNILLYDVFWVKINVYSKTSVYLWYFCYYTQIKIRLVTFFLLTKYVKRLDIRTHYLLWTGDL
jgi:multidrug transporter EmrE-like cation transporter